MACLKSSEINTKMCKKIAQLTKVIYTLHTKLEEHENILQALKDSYEQDIERITSQSQKELLAIKQQVEQYSDINRKNKDLKDLFEGVKNENSMLIEKLKSTEKCSALNANLMKTDFENKYLDLQNQFLEEKQNYEELQEKFNCLEKTFDAKKHEEITSLSLNHHNEIKKIKQVHSNELLSIREEVERLNEIIESFEAEKSSMQVEFEKRLTEYNLDCENKITKLKNFHKNEKEGWKSSLSKELCISWDKEREDMMKKHEDNLNNSQLVNTEQKYRINYLEKCIKERDIQIENYQANCGSLDFQIQENVRKILELEEEINAKEIHIESLKKEISNSTDANERLNSLRKHLLESTNKIKEMESKHAEDVKEKTAHIKSLVKTNSELTNELGKVKNSLETVQEEKDRHIYDNSLMKQQTIHLKGEKSSLSNTCKELTKKVEDLKKVCKENEDNFSQYKTASLQEKDDLKRQYEKDLKLLAEKHNKDIERFKNESEKILKHSQGELINEFSKNQEKALSEQRDVIAEKENTINELQVKLNEMNILLSNEKKNVKDKTKALSEMENEKNKLIETTKNIQDSLTSSELSVKKLKATLIETTSQLKTEREEALYKQAKFLQDQRDVVLEDFEKKLQLQHEAKINELIESFKEEKQVIMEKLMLEHGKELEKNKYMQDEEINSWNAKVEQLENDYKECKSKSHMSIEKLENNIRSLQEENCSVNRYWEERLQSTCQQKENEHTESIEALKKKHESELSVLQHSHQENIEEINQEHGLVCSALKKQYARKEKEVILELEERFTKEKRELQESMKLQKDEAIKLLKDSYEKKITNIDIEMQKEKELRNKEFEVHTRKILELSGDLEKSQQSFTNVEEELDDLRRQTIAIRKELELKVQEVLEVRRECNSRMRLRVEELSTDHRTVIDNIQANHMSDMRNAMKEWKDEKTKLENEILAYKTLLDESESRYMTRPSRDEDIAQIKHLQESLLQQDIFCQQLQEEKKLFKLELVNREENFNRVFSSNPNIGFLDPIQTNKKRSAKRKETNSRYSGK